MRMLFLLTSLLLFSTGQELLAQDSLVTINGKITDGQSGEEVPFVYVFNHNQKAYALSDTEGRFEIKMLRSDTLNLSSLGFEDLKFRLPASYQAGDEVHIKIEQDVITLNEIEVIGFKPIELFKREILDLQLEPEAKPMSMNFGELQKTSNAPAGEVTLMRIDGPITAVKNFVKHNFTKTGRLQKSFNKYASAYNTKAPVRAVFSQNFVSHVTGYQGEKLLAFMSFCKLSDAFILNANTYDLTLAILELKEDFEDVMG